MGTGPGQPATAGGGPADSPARTTREGSVDRLAECVTDLRATHTRGGVTPRLAQPREEL